MKLKKLLFNNLILILVSCNQSEIKEQDNSLTKDKSIKTESDSIVSVNKDKELDLLPNDTDTDSVRVSTTTNTTKLKTDSNTDMVRIGNPKEYYIVDKEMRRKDSINIFTPELLNNRMNNRLINKGILNKFERDSIIWDFWQKKIIDNDSTHIYIPYSKKL